MGKLCKIVFLDVVMRRFGGKMKAICEKVPISLNVSECCSGILR